MITYREIFEKNRIIFKFLKLSQIFGNKVYMKVAKFYNGLIFKKFQLRRISLINDTEVKEYIKDMENYVSFNDGYGKIILNSNTRFLDFPIKIYIKNNIFLLNK